MSMTIKKGDTVVVIAGKEKGKSGKVTEVSRENNRVLVDGVNIVTKHQKARKQDEKSQIVKKNAPVEASNLMVVCPACGKATRVAHSTIDGKKVRVCKKCSASLDKEFAKAVKKEAKKSAPKAEKVEEVAEKPVKAAKAAPKTAKTASKTTKTATQKSKKSASAKAE